MAAFCRRGFPELMTATVFQHHGSFYAHDLFLFLVPHMLLFSKPIDVSIARFSRLCPMNVFLADCWHTHGAVMFVRCSSFWCWMYLISVRLLTFARPRVVDEAGLRSRCWLASSLTATRSAARGPAGPGARLPRAVSPRLQPQCRRQVADTSPRRGWSGHSQDA